MIIEAVEPRYAVHDAAIDKSLELIMCPGRDFEFERLVSVSAGVERLRLNPKPGERHRGKAGEAPLPIGPVQPLLASCERKHKYLRRVSAN